MPPIRFHGCSWDFVTWTKPERFLFQLNHEESLYNNGFVYGARHRRRNAAARLRHPRDGTLVATATAGSGAGWRDPGPRRSSGLGDRLDRVEFVTQLDFAIAYVDLVLKVQPESFGGAEQASQA